jgi:4-alpha-glucanotransferase
VLLMPGRAPADATLEVVAAVLDDHLRSHSLFTVFVLPDLFALRSELRVEDVDSERVNQPAVRHHYWRYRLHISLEEMLTSYGYLADAFARMVSTSGRGTSYSALAH